MSSRATANPFFLPTQISGCQLWLDAADTSTFNLSGSNVLQWNDKSGNARNAVPRDNTKLPTRNLGFNQRFTVQSSSDESFGTPLLVNIASSNVQGSSGMSLFMAFRFLSGTVLTQYESPRIISFEGTNRFDYGEANVVYTPPGYTNTVNSIVNLNINVSANNLEFRFQGSTLLSTTPSLVTTQFTTSIGLFGRGGSSTNVPAQAQISEYIIYNTTLTLSQRQQVEGYLAWKWGLQSSLPANHPFKSSIIPPLLNPPATLPTSLGIQAISTPPQILAPSYWLDAADSSSITLTGGLVSQWNDKSGNGYNATQSVAGSRPSYSQNMITFNNNTYLDFPQAAINNAARYSLFLVFFPISSTNWILAKQKNGFGSYNMLSMTNYWQTNVGTTNSVYWAAHANTAGSISSGAFFTPRAMQLVEIIYDGTTLIMYSNGTQVAAGSSTAIQNITDATNCTIGSWRPDGGIQNSGVTNFRMGELLYFNTNLTTSQRQSIELYLQGKWGTSYQIPRTNLRIVLKSVAAAATFLPTQISGTQVWLDGADPNGNGTIVTNGTLISTWRDKSGNNNNATQATAINQPVYQTNLLNGLPTLQFPAISRNNLVALDTSAFNYGTTNRTSFFVLRNNYVSGTPAVSPHWFWPKSGNGTAAQSLVGWLSSVNRSTGVDFSISAPVGSFFILTNIFGASRFFEQMYTNGNPSNGNSLTRSGAYISATSGYRIGALDNADVGSSAFWFDGNIAEIILFNQTLTVSQIKQVEGYLAWKWGLVGSLPNNHPFKLWPPLPLTTYDVIAAPTTTLSGGTQITAGGFTYHLFTTSGTLSTTVSGTANYLVVGGGGGGGDRHGGGGGAGGVLSGTFIASGSYTITVGAGGQYGATSEGGQTPYGNPAGSGTKGGDSSISGVATAFGGGGGGTYDGNPIGVSGSVGSGGGGGGLNLVGVAGTSGQGNSGGSGANPGGGGGGGAGGNGSNANTSTGGIGTSAYSTHLLNVGYGTSFATSPQSPISGGVAYIAGGGGGAADSGTNPTARAGGLGGGGTGDWDDAVITAGTSNTGGGGGASRSFNSGTTGRSGGSGLVLVWY